ncbi:hypothetical protein PUN28_014176 [Cardiocondyla obscurior]|uniref:RBR-type E3 ubiquitin transferase n=3 Tax=Cardiocondyla obscurior TaxID=286306 RepID=A0AAW2F448_9HYME
MDCEIANNLQRQEDEMTALSSIYDETEFFYAKNEKCIRCWFSLYPKFKDKLIIKLMDSGPFDDEAVSNDCVIGLVEHLPPIKLYIFFPDTYPSKTLPTFNISSVWLTPWEMSFICQKFDELWEENQGNEIVFLWLNFLQNDLFNFLNISEFLDISFLHSIYISRDKALLRLAELSDPRVRRESIFKLSLNIKNLLISYNERQHKTQFDENFYTCYICFEKCSGLNSIELENCQHIYCKSCMEKYIRINIVDYISVISCPTVDCKYNISANDIKTLCPNLFLHYEEMMLRLTLDTMEDVVHCPRISCQYPVIRDLNDDAPICPQCFYCFCIYCHKAYHGQALCKMPSNDIMKLVEKYKNSSNVEKKMLEKKYGRRQIQSIETYLTTEYLQDNTKSCPKCHSLISKIDGCNKMTCKHCKSFFCWLCNEQIYGYDHFNNVDSPCYGSLFEGTELNDIIDHDFDDIIDNLDQFFL